MRLFLNFCQYEPILYLDMSGKVPDKFKKTLYYDSKRHG